MVLRLSYYVFVRTEARETHPLDNVPSIEIQFICQILNNIVSKIDFDKLSFEINKFRSNLASRCQLRKSLYWHYPIIQGMRLLILAVGSRSEKPGILYNKHM